MALATAKLIKRESADGNSWFKDDVPLGREYRVDLDSVRKYTYLNKETHKMGDVTIVFAEQDGGLPGWMPLECLEINGKN